MRVIVLLFDTRFGKYRVQKMIGGMILNSVFSRRMRFTLYSQEGPHLYQSIQAYEKALKAMSSQQTTMDAMNVISGTSVYIIGEILTYLESIQWLGFPYALEITQVQVAHLFLRCIEECQLHNYILNTEPASVSVLIF